MALLLIYGKEVEKHYGTIIYGFLNLWIGLMSHFLSIGIAYYKRDHFPEFVEMFDLQEETTDSAWWPLVN